MPPVRAILIGVLGVLGVGVTLWVFVPAFQGRVAASRALGTHRLAVGAIIAVVALNALITLPLVPLVHLDQELTTGSFVLAALSTEIPMLLVVYGRLILPGGVSWAELGFRPLPLGDLFKWGLGAGALGFVGVAIVGALLSEIGLRQNQLEQFSFVHNEGPLAFAVLLIAAGVVAPVVEELFFRGFLFGLYRRRQPLWVAYVVSSLLFTVLHLEPTRMNLAQMGGLSVGIFLLAMLLAWLYQRTGSLYPGMLAHAANNATGLVLFYAFRIT